MAVRRRTCTKNPPMFSHEFVIQNHADIVACVAMVFVVGLMLQVSSPLASIFIALHHNVSITIEESPGHHVDRMLYTNGLKDIPAVFFYLLIAIVMHQIVQEYLLDRVNKKLHLSKIKHAKLNESGQLLCFYLASIVWAGDIIIREHLYNIKTLWEGYPHLHMTFMFKFFYIVQMAYWLHIFPELYFQRVKREDMTSKVQYASLYLAFIIGAYVFCFTKVGLCLLLLQYLADALFHACRLLDYADKDHISKPLFLLHDIVFVLARLGSICLAFLTFWHGLALKPIEEQIIDPSSGIYNTFAFRTLAMVAVCLLQAWLMWNFITFQLRRMREDRMAQSAIFVQTRPKKAAEKIKTKKDYKSRRDDDDESLPEVDQNTRKNLRQRK